MRRATRHDFASCNGFVVEGGQCMLGYMDPNWVAEEAIDSGGEDIYFDMVL